MTDTARVIVERVIKVLRLPRIALVESRLQELADELDAALTFEAEAEVIAGKQRRHSV